MPRYKCVRRKDVVVLLITCHTIMENMCPHYQRGRASMSVCMCTCTWYIYLPGLAEVPMCRVYI